MLELLALIGFFVIGMLFLKIFFGALGLAFHILLFPLKLVLGLVIFALALPFLILLLPVFLVFGLGVAVLGAFVLSIFAWAFAL
jgi:hypothetical protein